MKPMIGVALSAGLIASGAAANAQDYATNSAIDPAWTYELQLYLWATEVGGTALGEDFTLGFDQIVDNLNFALMGRLNAYQGPWMTWGELSYADLGKDGSSRFTISPAPDVEFEVKAVADAEVQTTIVSFGGGYKLVGTDTYALYGTFGARYLRLQSELKLDLNDRSFKADSDDDYWDAVVGVAGRAALNENWFMSYLADVGAGNSDLTWQAYVGVGYNFGRQDVVFGYRHMEWDLPDDDLMTEYYQSGPVLLWNIRF